MNKHELKNLITNEINKLGASMQDLPWEDPKFYKFWLSQTHYLVRHTTKFLALSAANIELKERDHHYTMLQHIQGELGHDLMPLEDLIQLGDQIENFLELQETKFLYQIQYYWIQFRSPYSICGYAFLLEGIAKYFGPSVLLRLQKSFGADSTLFLRIHSIVDQEHYEDGMIFLESIPESNYADIAENTIQSSKLYSQMIAEILDARNSNFNKKAS